MTLLIDNTRTVEGEVQLICTEPDCEGTMVFGGIRIDVYPPQYPHCCKLCGKVGLASQEYPRKT